MNINEFTNIKEKKICDQLDIFFIGEYLYTIIFNCGFGYFLLTNSGISILPCLVVEILRYMRPVSAAGQSVGPFYQ